MGLAVKHIGVSQDVAHMQARNAPYRNFDHASENNGYAAPWRAILALMSATPSRTKTME
jgi:hypothetical protein